MCATVHKKDQYLDKYNIVLVRIIEYRSLMFILITIATMRQFFVVVVVVVVIVFFLIFNFYIFYKNTIDI